MVGYVFPIEIRTDRLRLRRLTGDVARYSVSRSEWREAGGLGDDPMTFTASLSDAP